MDALAEKARDARWRTRFGQWIAGYGVANIVRDLGGKRVTSQAVYGWLSGSLPRIDRARALVKLSDGALTFGMIFSHKLEMAKLREREKKP